jgi:hypothetical protein
MYVFSAKRNRLVRTKNRRESSTQRVTRSLFCNPEQQPKHLYGFFAIALFWGVFAVIAFIAKQHGF